MTGRVEYYKWDAATKTTMAISQREYVDFQMDKAASVGLRSAKDWRRSYVPPLILTAGSDE